MANGIWLFTYAALWALLLAASIVLVAVARQVAEIYEQRLRTRDGDGLPVGVLAPSLPQFDVYDRPLGCSEGHHSSTLVLFLTTRCQSCIDVVAGLIAFSRSSTLVNLVLVIRAHPVQAKLFLGMLDIERTIPSARVLADSSGIVADRFQVPVTPYGVLVGTDGLVQAVGTGLRALEVGRQDPIDTVPPDRVRSIAEAEDRTHRRLYLHS